MTFIDGIKSLIRLFTIFQLSNFFTWFLYVIRDSTDLSFYPTTFPKHLTLSTQARHSNQVVELGQSG